jgi:two-component system OmpR family sensor kinase
VEICFRRAPRPSAARLLVPLVAAALALWAASRKVARWLARPLAEVADVARELGEGRLTARVALRSRETAELAEVGSAMNELAERIQHQLSAQRELLAAVSHELRTPLARVRLLAGLAEEAASDRERTQHLAALEREVMELDGLVGQLLAQSRLDFSEREARRIDAALLAARALERAGLDPASLEVEGTERHVLGDPTLLASALANLVHNALSHGGGLVRLVVWSSDAPRTPEVGAKGPRVVLEVHDDGPGIDPVDLERVFEPFQTGGSTAGAGSLGLGLALVARIARAHGGGAFAANRAPRGSVIGLWLPAERAGETAVVSRQPERG